MRINAVIYATDFSLGAHNAGLFASLLAESFLASLIVAHALTLPQAAMEVEIDRKLVSQQRKDLKTLLTSKAAQLASHSVKSISVLLEGDPKDVIPELANNHQPTIVVLRTHGGGRSGRIMTRPVGWWISSRDEEPPTSWRVSTLQATGKMLLSLQWTCLSSFTARPSGVTLLIQTRGDYRRRPKKKPGNSPSISRNG
jgi:nucleotide-binding universal stress UspA family protein